MLGFQTVSCLHDIPVIRSSTNTLQDVYAKAKKTSVLIRLSCNIAETIVDTSLKIVLTVTNPFVKRLTGPVRVIDDYAARKIRQIESKYPVINTPTEDVVNTFNEKTEPVRNVVNSMKDTTTATIQHGKETVSNVATATVNKATGVADTFFSFYRSGKQQTNLYQSRGLTAFACSIIGSLLNFSIQSIEASLIWFRLLFVHVLLKTKEINDFLLTKFKQTSMELTLTQRLLIIHGNILNFLMNVIQPDKEKLARMRRFKQQGQYFNNLPDLKPDPATRPRQNIFANKSEPLHVRSQPNSTRNNRVVNRQNQQSTRSNITDADELDACLAANNLHQSTTYDESNDYSNNPDISELHQRINPTDIELLYSKLPSDVLPNTDEQRIDSRVINSRLQKHDRHED